MRVSGGSGTCGAPLFLCASAATSAFIVSGWPFRDARSSAVSLHRQSAPKLGDYDTRIVVVPCDDERCSAVSLQSKQGAID